MLLPLLAAEPIPDTSGYMIAGYSVIFGIMLLYLISLLVRFRQTRRELKMLQDLEEQAEKKARAQEKLLSSE